MILYIRKVEFKLPGAVLLSSWLSKNEKLDTHVNVTSIGLSV